MDLNTDLLGPPGTAGRVSGDEAGQVGESAVGWNSTIDVGEAKLFEDAAAAGDLSAGQRDQFFDGFLKIQEDERLRLGRELHDSTGQLLLALRLNLARLKRMHGSPVEDDLIDEIESTASQIDREIRSFAFLHYPAEIEGAGLSETLRYLTRGFANRTGLKISFASLCDGAGGDSPAAIALLRVAQEALMNVYRHARAEHVRVTLSVRNRMLELIVRDDGVGLSATHDATKANGVGLPGMRHRVGRLGGHFAVKSMKHGTKLVASVPMA